MSIKTLFLAGCILLSSSLYAAEQVHVYPNEDGSDTELRAERPGWPGYCEIEILNNSYTDIRVYGMYEDGMILHPFNVYSFEYPHYISLYYFGYCHMGIDLRINTLNGYNLYAGYTPVNSILHIIPYMMNAQPNVKLCSRGKTC